MDKNNQNESKHDFKEFMDMKLKEVLATIAYNMEEDGADIGDVGRMVFENKYY